MRRPLLRITALAAILLSLTTAVTAFATMDKTVRLDVDGQHLVLRTFAGNVAGVLRKAHLALGPHDTVAPDVRAPVRDGAQVIVRHARLLTVDVDGESHQVWVTALSVDEALDQLGLRSDGEWVSASRSQAIPRRGLSVAVRLPQQVSVLVDGRRITTMTTAPDVASLLRDVGVQLGPLDTMSTPATTYPLDGLVVSIDRVSRGTATRNVAIPFRTVRVRTRALYVGESRVVRRGRPGLRVETFQLTWKNHKLAVRRLVHAVVRAKPTAQVVEVGTHPKPRYWPANDGLDWPALARCESGGNPREVSGNGQYRGLYQFTLGTWHSVGGPGDPIDASVNEQTYFAQILYRRVGDSAWPTCGHYLYS